jgi:hypothetical protein
MAENNGGNGGGPWWVRVLLQVGPAAAIALFLVWVLAGQWSTRLDAIDSRMTRASAQMSEFVVKQTGFETEVRAENAWKLSLLRQICLNTSKNDTDRRACVVQ